MKGVILYGPPAAGKDSVTKELVSAYPHYRLYQRLKVGGGRTTGYRMTSSARVTELRQAGDVIWENRRYNATYVVDRPHLRAMLADGEIPVVHLGQVPAVAAVTAALPDVRWLRVYLWCPRDVAAGRVEARGTGDLEDRLRAWDETEPLTGADLEVNTATAEETEVAATINQRLQ